MEKCIKNMLQCPYLNLRDHKIPVNIGSRSYDLNLEQAKNNEFGASRGTFINDTF